MNTTITAALVSGGIAAIVSIIAILISRRSEREANATQDELAEFNILRGTVTTLNEEVDRLRGSLAETNHDLDMANKKIDRLNRQLDSAQMNVLILSEHIRQYVSDDVQFPRLRRITDINGG